MVEAGAHHDDGFPIGAQRSFVGGGVDAGGSPGPDGPASFAEPLRKKGCESKGWRGGATCSYDGDRPGLREGAAHEQASRCFGHGAHGDGIIGV